MLHRTIALEAVWASEGGSPAVGSVDAMDCAPVGSGLGWEPTGAGEFLKRLEEARRTHPWLRI